MESQRVESSQLEVCGKATPYRHISFYRAWKACQLCLGGNLMRGELKGSWCVEEYHVYRTSYLQTIALFFAKLPWRKAIELWEF